jgi:hypothetical protein
MKFLPTILAKLLINFVCCLKLMVSHLLYPAGSLWYWNPSMLSVLSMYSYCHYPGLVSGVCMCMCVQVEPRLFCTSVVNTVIQICISWWTTPLYVICMSFFSPSLSLSALTLRTVTLICLVFSIYFPADWPIFPFYLTVLCLICLASSISIPGPNRPIIQDSRLWYWPLPGGGKG